MLYLTHMRWLERFLGNKGRFQEEPWYKQPRKYYIRGIMDDETVDFVRKVANRHHTTVEEVMDIAIEFGLKSLAISEEGGEVIIRKRDSDQDLSIIFFDEEI